MLVIRLSQLRLLSSPVRTMSLIGRNFSRTKTLNNEQIPTKLDKFRQIKVDLTTQAKDVLAKDVESLKSTMSNMYESVMFQYNEAFGINETENYHKNIFKIEQSLLDSSEKKRDTQEKLTQLRSQINGFRNEMEKTSHSDEKYVQLFVKVHDLNKIETELLNRLKTEEERERQLLTFYLENVRKSFQMELRRQNAYKYISYIYYLLSSLLALACYSFGRYRNSNLQGNFVDLQNCVDELVNRSKYILNSLETIGSSSSSSPQQAQGVELTNPKVVIITCIVLFSIYKILTS